MIEQRFQVDGPAEIEISASSGSVTVESGPPGEVHVQIDARNPEGWQLRQNGRTVAVLYERSLVERGGRARIRVVAPEGCSLNARTASADVRALVHLDRTSVATASGDVALGEVASASIKTASGDVALGRVERELSVRSAAGDVRVRAVEGPASLISASGDVLVDEAGGDVSVSTASGDLRVGRYTGEDLEASTMSGDLDVGLPPGRTVKLDAKTLSGSVRMPERKAPGGSPGPYVSLRLKTVSGDITIRRLGREETGGGA